jgi:Xaa-Pro aminopeptidase
MHSENLIKLAEALKSQGVEAALISNPFNITWLTGYAPSIQTGPSPFEGGPALGWFYNGELTLLLTDWEAGPAGQTGVNVHPYVGYTVDEPLACVQRMSAALGEMLKPFSGLKGTVGVEMNQLPAALYPALQAALPGASLLNLDRQIDPLRAVKSGEEIRKIRAALRLCDLAQEEIRGQIRPGVTELELWQRVKSRVEMEAGSRVPVLADLVAGQRTGDIGGLPLDYALQAGDPVLLDFVPRLDGYWGDNCAGYFVGEPAPELKMIYTIVKGSLKAGAEAIRPGLKAEELDALVRNFIENAGYQPYPHHTGHGLGASYHEEPRIVPNHEIRLEPGMVLVLEPGIYLPGVGGVRLEDAFLVTPDGCEVLTKHLLG